ncbi:MAG: UPF0755 protein [Candidatus Azotimanducaceae bacterium]|jgi:UPF0755 protein
MIKRITGLAVLGSLLFLISYTYLSLTKTITPKSEYFLIKSGIGLNAVIDQLKEQKIIPMPKVILKTYAYLTKNNGGIKAGEYQLQDRLTAIDLLENFREGRVIQRQIVFPEGLTFAEWRNRLEANSFVEQTLKGKSDQAIMSMLGSELTYAEGQFFPDTYQFHRSATDFSILLAAYERMNGVMEREWPERQLEDYFENKQDVLIFASLVEKETGYGPERDLIASVFANRLRRGMKLQSDPTAIYGLPSFDGDLKRSHLRRDSPYNTYVIKGLPLTPICNPGLASIRASLRPPPSEFYYFVAKGDGSSQFSATLKEHNAAVNRYQRAGRVKQYISTPKN